MRSFRLIYTTFPEQVRGNIRGITFLDKGKYTVLIDSTLNPDQQEETLKHELAHVVLDHGNNAGDLEQLEREATEYAEQMTPQELQNILKYAKWQRYKAK